MFKKILIALLSAQLVIVPAQAETKCTKSFIGLDDAIIIFMGSWIVITILDRWATKVQNDELKKKLEQEKAKQPASNTCML